MQNMQMLASMGQIGLFNIFAINQHQLHKYSTESFIQHMS